MSMVAVLSIHHHLHVDDDTVRLDKPLPGSETSGRPSPLSVIAPECSGKARRPDCRIGMEDVDGLMAVAGAPIGLFCTLWSGSP